MLAFGVKRTRYGPNEVYNRIAYFVDEQEEKDKRKKRKNELCVILFMASVGGIAWAGKRYMQGEDEDDDDLGQSTHGDRKMKG